MLREVLATIREIQPVGGRDPLGYPLHDPSWVVTPQLGLADFFKQYHSLFSSLG